jgi:hypothetical protein
MVRNGPALFVYLKRNICRYIKCGCANPLHSQPPPGAGDPPTGPFLLPKFKTFCFVNGNIATCKNRPPNILISYLFFAPKALVCDHSSLFLEPCLSLPVRLCPINQGTSSTNFLPIASRGKGFSTNTPFLSVPVWFWLIINDHFFFLTFKAKRMTQGRATGFNRKSK